MTEKNDLVLFQKHCQKWVDKLGLTDWDFRVTLNDDADNGNVLLNPEGRKAYIGLCRKREPEVSIEQIAKHETLEILFADISFLLQTYYSKELIDDEIHKVINRLMVVLLEDDNDFKERGLK